MYFKIVLLIAFVKFPAVSILKNGKLYVISPDDIKAGNWISLNYPGSLIAARKVLEIGEYGVVIENGKINTLIKAGDKWEYPEVTRQQLVSFREIKGIPLTCEILLTSGFKSNNKALLKEHPGAEDSIIIYSDEHLFALSCRQGTTNIFTHANKNSNIEFVHQLQNLYKNCMDRELEISVKPFNFKFSSNF